jgi:formylglycine-generating enzyme required for sulfatase activity
MLSHPVETVTWSECEDVCRRFGLELPSEAQWEYGARGGTTTPWWTGAERDSLATMQAANLADQAAKRLGAPWGDVSSRWPELDDGYPVHAPVNTLAANPFGLHHVHGNVWELCLDGADELFYASSPALDPLAEPAGYENRVSRGGGFQGSEVFATSSYRDAVGPETPDQRTGLRPMRVIEDPAEE